MNAREKRLALEEQVANPAISAAAIDPTLVVAWRGMYNRFIKRVLDLLLAVPMAIVLSPLLLLIGLAIMIDDGLPVFYRAERGGYRGKTFRIFKFRTMIRHADKVGGGTTALNDNRITRVGAFLRKTKMDEIANLLSIIKGDMSFIGPRPELLRYTQAYSGSEKLIEEVRPGITDYSSIEFINLDEIVGAENADEAFEKHVLPRKNKLRVKYAGSVSFAVDVFLFTQTVWRVIKKALCYIIPSSAR